MATSRLSGHLAGTSALPPRADIRAAMSALPPISSAYMRRLLSRWFYLASHDLSYMRRLLSRWFYLASHDLSLFLVAPLFSGGSCDEFHVSCE